MERLLAQLNTALNSSSPGERNVLRAAFAPGQPLSESFRALGDRLTVPDGQSLSAVDGFPPALRESFRAALYSALEQKANPEEQVGPIHVVWQGAYDFGLEVTHSLAHQGSQAGMTIIVRSRYLFDEHPSTGKALNAS